MDLKSFISWLEEFPTDKSLSVQEVISAANKYLLESDDDINAIRVIEYLNSQAGTTFSTKTKKTIQLVNARFKEGFTFVDFKIVIDKKVKQWLSTEQAVYLRPITLFNATKFETYLNETVITKNAKNGKSTKLEQIKSEVTKATQSDWGLD